MEFCEDYFELSLLSTLKAFLMTCSTKLQRKVVNLNFYKEIREGKLNELLFMVPVYLLSI